MKSEIKELVERRPGIHFREVQRELDCSSTTLNHHLDTLDLIERRFHGYRRIFPSDVSEEMYRPLAALNHDVRGKLLCLADEGVSQKELVESVDRSKSTVSTHLKIMEDDGLIEEKKKGRKKEIHPTKKAVKALKKYAENFAEDTCEGFVEMWE